MQSSVESFIVGNIEMLIFELNALWFPLSQNANIITASTLLKKHQNINLWQKQMQIIKKQLSKFDLYVTTAITLRNYFFILFLLTSSALIKQDLAA